MAETLKLTPNESVAIRQSSPEVLEVEGSYGALGRARGYKPGSETFSATGP
jgi:hypothetical protein